MKVLITGVGITGKSTYRRELKKQYTLLSPDKRIIDIDGDYEQLPNEFEKETVYIVEDVHATLRNACLSLQNYDLIFYLYPLFYYHLIFWLKRVWVWFLIGYGSWDKHRNSWLGSKKPYDIKNLPLFLKLMLHDLWNRKKWINEDKKAFLSFKNVIIIRSRWTTKGIKFKPLG